MKINLEIASITDFKADAIIVNLFEGVTQPAGGTGAVDKALDGGISNELQHGATFKGKLGETMVFSTLGKLPARYVILVGLGKQEEFKSRELRRASAAAIRACDKLKVKTAGTLLHGAGIGNIPAEVAARLLTEGSLLGSYRFTLRKTAKEDGNSDTPGFSVETLTLVENDASKKAQIEEGIRVGTVIADATNLARDLVFDSANHVNPTFMAQTAQSVAGAKVSCKVYEQDEIEKLGMGSFLNVAKGSIQPPKLIHMTYKPNGAPRKKVTLVGKGITFDSGGLSLKPPASMETMKMDMSGAAAVVCTMKAIEALGNLDIQVDAIAPCCENMPSGGANKPGDIITAMSGKTIEINNTDAEGRLILCDALTYAQEKVSPDELIDLATLTGACVVALGKEASGIMGTDEGLIEGIRQAGDEAGERFWPLPLYDEYKEMLKSDVADLINSGSKGQAGSSAGGIFLKAFIEDGQKWAHLDIAGPAYTRPGCSRNSQGGNRGWRQNPPVLSLPV